MLKWITNPHAFRPDSRMPRFYGLSNNNDEKDWPKNYAEIHAITHYLFSKSTPPAEFVDPPAKTDPAKGKELFLQKGCMACHQHRPYQTADLQLRDRNAANPAYKVDPALTYDPKNFPAAAQEYAQADFGPNLSNMADKFQSKPAGLKWLSNWIGAPEKYHPKSLMPNLQLAPQDAADIASWILSVPGEWPVKVEVPPKESKEVTEAVDELVKLYVSKSGTLQEARRQVGGHVTQRGRRVRQRAQARTKSCFIWAKRRSRGWAASAVTRSLALKTPSRSGLRSMTGESSSRPDSISDTSRNT